MATPLVGHAVPARESPRSHRPAPVRTAELPVYDVVVGLTVATVGRTMAGWRVGRYALRPVVDFALRPPLLPARLQPIAWVQTRARAGRAYRVRVVLALQEILPAVVNAVLDHIDLTSIVLDHVELDQIIDAVLDRIDLAALSREVIDDIDLPGIVRESTGIMTSEAVVGIRMHGIRADESVSRVVDRVLLRRAERKTQSRMPSGANDATER